MKTIAPYRNSWRTIAFAFVLGAGAGMLVALVIIYPSRLGAQERGSITRQKGYELTSPILACEIAPKEAFTEFKPVETALATFIAKATHDGKVTQASAYLRTLNSGRWLGVNEDATYAPASMLKVLVMMAYLKAAETDPPLLARTITLNQADAPESDTFELPIARLQSGKKYTIEGLLRAMIVNSSNTALSLLTGYGDENVTRELENIFANLNLPPLPSQNEDDLNFMSPKVYSLTFRVLYGATYLNDEMSQYALDLLSETAFTGGLRAGVPAEIAVAHKFGIRSVPAQPSPTAKLPTAVSKELHDCGIVYYPGHPYLLCIMTKGTDFGTLQSFIAGVSDVAFKGIDTYFKNQQP